MVRNYRASDRRIAGEHITHVNWRRSNRRIRAHTRRALDANRSTDNLTSLLELALRVDDLIARCRLTRLDRVIVPILAFVHLSSDVEARAHRAQMQFIVSV
jgi:hypothetical protein